MTVCDICGTEVKHVIHCFIPVNDSGLPLKPDENEASGCREVMICRGCYDLYRRSKDGARVR